MPSTLRAGYSKEKPKVSLVYTVHPPYGYKARVTVGSTVGGTVGADVSVGRIVALGITTYDGCEVVVASCAVHEQETASVSSPQRVSGERRLAGGIDVPRLSLGGRSTKEVPRPPNYMILLSHNIPPPGDEFARASAL